MPPKDNTLERKETKAALCYIPFLGWMPSVAYLIIEKDPMVRWNAVQSLILHAILAGVYFVAVPLLRMTIVLVPLAGLLQGLVGVAFFIACLYMVTKINQGESVRIPVAAEWADKFVKRV